MKNQFETLQNWTLEVLKTIKKDIKQEHLGLDQSLYQKYFGNRPKNRLTSEEIFTAYENELKEGNSSLAEWVVNRWVFKNGELYNHFAERLSEIDPDFASIQTLSLEQSQRVLDGAEEAFGPIPVFLFTYLNGVVFPESIMQTLEEKALQRKEEIKEENETQEESLELEKVVASQKREIARLEAKVQGVLKKYEKDVTALKKQVQALQKRLSC